MLPIPNKRTVPKLQGMSGKKEHWGETIKRRAQHALTC
jgi:hypothetical protein